MMVLKEYENLTEDELVFADHYAETNNGQGLRKMQELSKSRENNGERARWHHTATNRT